MANSSQKIFLSAHLFLFLWSILFYNKASSFSAYYVQSSNRKSSTLLLTSLVSDNNNIQEKITTTTTTRRLILSTILLLIPPLPAYAKCTDIESCREIGEKKVEQDLIDNPITKLNSGVRYKVLQPGTGDQTVNENSIIDLIYSVSTMSGGYIYSQGFGYEKIDMLGDGNLVKDTGLDSIKVKIGERNVPIGIEDALIGMKKGERRRAELPPYVGLSTSNGQPEPRTRRAKAGLLRYQQLVDGTASTPGFPAALIWDVEVLKIR